MRGTFEIYPVRGDSSVGSTWTGDIGACPRGITFNNEHAGSLRNIVHTKVDGDPRESCSEYNRRIIDQVSKDQKWCPSCTEIVFCAMLVKDCKECMAAWLRPQSSWRPLNLHRGQTNEDFSGEPPQDSPRWWTFQDPDIQALLSVQETNGPDGLFPWIIPVNDTDGVALARLGFDTACPICFGLARTLLSKIQALKEVPTRIILESLRYSGKWFRPQEPREPLIRFRVLFECSWIGTYDGGVSKPSQTFENFKMLLNKDLDKPGFYYYEPRRFNPRFLKQKLDEQFEGYSSCLTRTGEHNANLPSSFRLIDVNNRCLVTVGNTLLKYSAISYRWDSTDNNMLTKETESIFFQPGSLSLKTMSRLLFDCMSLAQDLDIPYIWVDRYCIIQDSDIDKAEQIYSMGNIYTNSWLTIMCAHVQSIHAGIPGYSRDFTGMLERLDPKDFYGSADMWNCWYRSPRPEWVDRGWTMQEEYLSPRRLYSMDRTLLWHINCPTVVYDHIALNQPVNPTGRCCLDFNKSLPEILSIYVGRNLTMSTDRINAISGLLQAHNVEHIYGIGIHNMRYNLVWGFGFNQHTTQYADEFPTWSWAYSHSKSQWPSYPRHKHQPKSSILHYKTPISKRPKLLRRMGIPSSLTTHLTDRHLILRAPATRLRPSDRAKWDYNAMWKDKPTWKPPYKPIHINLYTTLYSNATQVATHSIVVEPFPPRVP